MTQLVIIISLLDKIQNSNRQISSKMFLSIQMDIKKHMYNHQSRVTLTHIIINNGLFPKIAVAQKFLHFTQKYIIIFQDECQLKIG